MEILQLWVNLPARLKMTAPAYTGVQKDRIPVLASPDGRAKVHLIAGEWSGGKGPITSLTGIFMTTVEMNSGGRVEFDGLGGRTVFLYIVRGAIRIEGADAPAFHLVELSKAGTSVEIRGKRELRASVRSWRPDRRAGGGAWSLCHEYDRGNPHRHSRLSGGQIRRMTFLRRALLLVLLLVVPLLLTQALALGTDYLLAALRRYVEPDTLRYAAIAEFGLFFLIGLLEVRGRW